MSKEVSSAGPKPLKNLSRAITNIKKDVVYDWQHGAKGSKSKPELEKEKQIKAAQLKEALQDREDADKTIKDLIDEVVNLKDTLASRDGRIEELTNEFNKEAEDKQKEIEARHDVEAQLAKEKQRTQELESALQAEKKAKEESEALRAQEIEYP